MNVEIDHYRVLGLPSGEEGAKLSEKEILKAYKRKALVLHPDKRPLDDPNAAHADFQILKSSFDVLKDDKQRKQFDQHLLILKQQQQHYYSDIGAKRRKIVVSIRKERERAAAAVRAREEREWAAARAREARKRAASEEEMRIARKLQEEVEMFKLQGVHEMELEEEIARMKINAMRANKRTSAASASFDSFPWRKRRREFVAFGGRLASMDDDY